MSRIGKIPVSIPEKVSVTIDSKSISIKGPKGELKTPNSEFVTIKQEENFIKVSPSGNSRKSKEFFGMYRAMVQNMITGVSVGFEKKLELPYVEILHYGDWSQEVQDKFVFNNFIEGTKVPHEGIVIKYHTGEREKIAKVINPDYLIFAEKHNVGDSH